MPMCLCNGANLMCSFGTAPSALVVPPKNKVLTSNMPAATIMDNVPMTNIMPFGMCNSVANPATKRPPPVLFTPAPCMPVIAAPWAPGSATVLIGNMPALNNTSQLMCNWAGVIKPTAPGQTACLVP